MKEIAGIRSFNDDGTLSTKPMSNTEIRKAEGCRVKSLLDLTWKVAELQYANPEHLLLFRGQNNDHRNEKGNTTLKPSLFHPPKLKAENSVSKEKNKSHISREQIKENFEKLKRAEVQLSSAYGASDNLGKTRMRRYRILRWAILQHYGVCGTPLLDITQSLRIAASFACLENPKETGFVYVLGVPNLSGTLTANAEAGLQVIRLSSICPASARRPHIQQGYLIGEYPEMGNWDQKELYPQYEVDPARRLVAKFRIDTKAFTSNGGMFPMIDREGLYQEEHDSLFQLTRPVKQVINPDK